MMQRVLDYIDAHRERFVHELIDWVRIPSISALPAHAPDMKRNAEHLAAALAALGGENVRVIETAGHPAVFAEWNHAPGKPTLLVYGHHDVQPVAGPPARPLESGAASSTTRGRCGSTRRPSRRS